MTTSTATTTITISLAIVSNICIGSNTYTTRLLDLYLTLPLSWTAYSFTYTAPNVHSARLAFAIRNDPSFWCLDDVSVRNTSGGHLLSKGDFEQGNLSGWTYCNPNNATSAGTVTASSPLTGLYSYENGFVGSRDYLSQTLAVVPYNNYSVQFWFSASSSSLIFATMTISS